MNIKKRIDKEKKLKEQIKKGYTRTVATKWNFRNNKRKNEFKGKYDDEHIKKSYDSGYYPDFIDRYECNSLDEIDYIKDIDYISISYINNTFKKWISNWMYVNNIFYSFEDFMPKIHASIVKYHSEAIVYEAISKEIMSKEDLIQLVKKEGTLILQPSFFNSSSRSYLIYYDNFDEENIVLKSGNQYITWERFCRIFSTNYILKSNKIERQYGKRLTNTKVEVFIGNEENTTDNILQMVIRQWDEENKKYTFSNLNSNNYYEYGLTKELMEKIENSSNIIASRLRTLSYFSVVFFVYDNDIEIERFNSFPELPNFKFSSKLNDFLKEKVKLINSFYVENNVNRNNYYGIIQNKIKNKVVKKTGKKGIRQYMQLLWLNAVMDDLKNTKNISLKTKIWAWKRGFLSFRVHQYGLTEENYKNYLSDYDYHWLNRINGVYTSFINDKTSFRYSLRQFKDHLPEYYFLIFKEYGKTKILSLLDYEKQDHQYLGNESIIELLKEKKELAFKPSAGLHGDGFYKLEFNNDEFFINGKKVTEDELITHIHSQNSFYIITDYLHMHPELAKIYPNSVNTLRLMVLNNSLNEPIIAQSYMRIGSSKTNFTDNVAFGGIVAKVDLLDGKYYGAERLLDHFYEPCKVHPDTGVEIEGYIPEWGKINEVVLNIAKSIPELDYLGFDVVVSDKGIKILEINIHQDLHKVAEYTDVINEFFNEKKKRKKAMYSIK